LDIREDRWGYRRRRNPKGYGQRSKAQGALIYAESRQKAERALIYTGYYYDTYGIGTPW
jgi:hypothetical protein